MSIFPVLWDEPFGFVAIESLALGTPVISFRRGALPEIVEDGVSGLLIPPRDDRALAEAIISIFESPELRRRLGENARRKVEQQFDINKNIKQYLGLFGVAGNGPS